MALLPGVRRQKREGIMSTVHCVRRRRMRGWETVEDVGRRSVDRDG